MARAVSMLDVRAAVAAAIARARHEGREAGVRAALDVLQAAGEDRGARLVRRSLLPLPKARKRARRPVGARS